MPEDRTAEEREAARREREAARQAREEPQAQSEYAEPRCEYAEPHSEDGWPESDYAEPQSEYAEPQNARARPQRAGLRLADRPPRADSRRPRPPVRRPRRAAPAGGHSRRNRIAALVALILAAAIVWFCVELFQPFAGPGHGSVTVVIPPHSSSSKVGDLLARDGVISSSFFFGLRATLDGDRGNLRSGTYHLKRGMSYGSVLAILTKPPPAAKVTEVTIVPGHTRRQINSLLHSQGISGSYLNDTRSSPMLSPGTYGAPAGTDSLEGFLFPDTYQLRVPVGIPALVADQLTTFKQRFATVNLAYARSKHLTPYDVLIIASMIEGEAQTPGDLAKVSSTIYNRLSLGMPLQIDATVRYAVDNYTSPITKSQLHSKSPWNTYTHKGLPPTPIDNPSLASIKAAAQPAHDKYLYFVVKPCGNGAMVFTSSYSQFLVDSQRYEAARARRGGRSPAACS